MNVLKVALGIIAALLFLWIFGRIAEVLDKVPAWPILLVLSVGGGIYFAINESRK